MIPNEVDNSLRYHHRALLPVKYSPGGIVKILRNKLGTNDLMQTWSETSAIEPVRAATIYDGLWTDPESIVSGAFAGSIRRGSQLSLHLPH